MVKGPPVKDKALEVLDRATDRLYVETRHGLERVKGLDRYLKARIAIVATWALFSLATVCFVLSASSVDNELGAKVRWGVTDILGGTYVIVENQGEAWHDVEIHLNERYVAFLQELPSGEAQTVPSSAFLDPLYRPLLVGYSWPMDGPESTISAPLTTRPERLFIVCEEGSLEVELGEGEGEGL